MTEPSNQLLLIQLIRCHLHPPHLYHLRIKHNKMFLCRLHLQRRHVHLVDVERVFGELDLER